MNYDSHSDRSHNDHDRNHDDDALRHDEQSTGSSLENILERHLTDLDAEHALLMQMWNTPGPGEAVSAPVDAATSATAAEIQAEAAPGHVTVVHQARALTAGDLRAALIGIPDDQPVALDVPLDPGGLVLHRYVLTSTAPAVLLLAEEDEILDPSLVLRGDFPTGVYEVPTDEADDETSSRPR